jgi:hypothetical protein
MTMLKFVAAYLAAFMIADLQLNQGRTVQILSAKVSRAAYQLNQAVILSLPRRVS